MFTLLNRAQTRLADEFTIQRRKMQSIDLMESAARAFVSVFKGHFNDPDLSISVYCGTGNNGGDGLAIARILKEEGYERVCVKIVRFTVNPGADFTANLERLSLTGINRTELTEGSDFCQEEADVLIDAMLGSGLNKPVSGFLAKLIDHLNALGKIVVAVDVPSGFPSEGKINLEASVLKSDLVISFQLPKINFFFPESAGFIRQFKFVDIGLDEDFIQSQPGKWFLIEEWDIRKTIKIRENFSHKGIYGHALIIAGNAETLGAALMCADACLHAGAGLTTACIPASGLSSLNTRSPEIMAILRDDKKLPAIDFEKYQSIAIGPGLGVDQSAKELLHLVLENAQSPMVIDADGLNMLAQNPSWLSLIPHKSILTPHVKEFDRLFGDHDSWWDRLETARAKAAKLQLIIVLKNRYSFIVLPNGEVWINPSGNPAMATGGSGDVLTGMIGSFLAQGYKPEESAMLGCYLHGKAGDVLKTKSGMFSIPPRYLIQIIPEIINSTLRK
jgi:ADP-dependent NAD(P)H-hydrate dehydratase / NAD(P)H-hydrate epimerase